MKNYFYGMLLTAAFAVLGTAIAYLGGGLNPAAYTIGAFICSLVLSAFAFVLVDKSEGKNWAKVAQMIAIFSALLSSLIFMSGVFGWGIMIFFRLSWAEALPIGSVLLTLIVGGIIGVTVTQWDSPKEPSE